MKQKKNARTHFYPICPETLVKYEICADTAHKHTQLFTFTRCCSFFSLFLNDTLWESGKCIATHCLPVNQTVWSGLCVCVCGVWITESDHMNERAEIRFNGNVCALIFAALHTSNVCGSSVQCNCCSMHILGNEQEVSTLVNPFIQLISWNWNCALWTTASGNVHTNAIRSQGMLETAMGNVLSVFLVHRLRSVRRCHTDIVVHLCPSRAPFAISISSLPDTWRAHQTHFLWLEFTGETKSALSRHSTRRLHFIESIITLNMIEIGCKLRMHMYVCPLHCVK